MRVGTSAHIGTSSLLIGLSAAQPSVHGRTGWGFLYFLFFSTLPPLPFFSPLTLLLYTSLTTNKMTFALQSSCGQRAILLLWFLFQPPAEAHRSNYSQPTGATGPRTVSLWRVPRLLLLYHLQMKVPRHSEATYPQPHSLGSLSQELMLSHNFDLSSLVATVGSSRGSLRTLKLNYLVPLFF